MTDMHGLTADVVRGTPPELSAAIADKFVDAVAQTKGISCEYLLGRVPAADPADLEFYLARIRRSQIRSLRRWRRRLPVFVPTSKRAGRARRQARKQRRGWA